jgi:hypothetical protein
MCYYNTDSYTAADTIRILVATDSHVGYEERDAIRKDDSWRSFDEVMQLAKTEDVSPSPSAGSASEMHYLLMYSRWIWFSSLATSFTITSLPENPSTKLCDRYE